MPDEKTHCRFCDDETDTKDGACAVCETTKECHLCHVLLVHADNEGHHGDELCKFCEEAVISEATDLIEALHLLVQFADQVLPQAGRLSFDIGVLNDGLMKARPALRAFGIETYNPKK